MSSQKVIPGDLFFHAVHGLCRLDRKVEQERMGKKVLCYSMVPRKVNKMKVRFVVAATDMDIAGFHKLITVREANEILKHLKDGDEKALQKNQTWVLAQNILTFSADKLRTRDQRKRQKLELSVRGLVGEFAFVFKTSLKEAADKIQKSLGQVSKTDPLVLAALENAAEF